MPANIIPLRIDENSAVPKYLQLAENILYAWVSGNLKEGELLPSLHDLSTTLEVSKRTAEKAYAI